MAMPPLFRTGPAILIRQADPPSGAGLGHDICGTAGAKRGDEPGAQLPQAAFNLEDNRALGLPVARESRAYEGGQDLFLDETKSSVLRVLPPSSST